MVNHICPNCNEIFDKKSTYAYHINRINPCKKTAEKAEFIKKIQKNPKNPKKSINPKNPKNDECCEKKDVDNTCTYCLKMFTTKSNLSKHIKNNCGVKKEQDRIFNICEKNIDNGKNIDNMVNIDKNEININLIKILEQNQILIKKLEEQEKQIKNNKKTEININNLQIVNIQKHGNEDLNKIENKDLLMAMTKQGVYGVGLLTNVIETIYVNQKYPTYQNIYITDENRQKCKIFNGKKWIFTDFKVIYSLISKVLEHSRDKLEEFQEKLKNNKNLYEKLKIFEKYLNFCEPSVLEELENEMRFDDVDNKDKIKDCREKTKILENQVIKLFYNNRDILSRREKIIEINY